MLISHQNLMNVVRVCRLPREMVLQHLKDVAQAGGIVDVDVGDAVVALHKKCKLQVSEMIIGLETAGRFEILELSGKVM